jgi:hypothetical protein
MSCALVSVRRCRVFLAEVAAVFPDVIALTSRPAYNECSVRILCKSSCFAKKDILGFADKLASQFGAASMGFLLIPTS